MRAKITDLLWDIEITMLVSFDINISGKTRNSVGRRALPSQYDVFLVEPDKLDIKRHVFFICHA